MSGNPLRFLHASDLHLEQPLHGVGHVPDHLIDTFLDAPFIAAERLFDLAVAEQVDFVVLSGDVLDPLATGPRGLDLLLRQFRRLEEHGIGVYWSQGIVDRFEAWPESVPFPRNVTIFSDSHVDSVTHRRDKKPVAIVQGCSTSERRTFSSIEFEGDASLPTVAVVYGKEETAAADSQASVQSLKERGITYWALGGVHASKTLCEGPVTAHYCGTIQGRRPEEESAHGCTLVEIDRRGRLHKRNISLDAARWCNVQVEVGDDMNCAGLVRLLRDRTHQLIETSPDQQVLIRWMLSDSDELNDSQGDILLGQLREGGLADELLDSLRKEFGMKVPGAWSVEFDVQPPDSLPAGWYDEDTILGDLLRVVRNAQSQPEKRLAHGGLPEGARVADEIAAALEIGSAEERSKILREVAALSIDLLRGDRILCSDFVIPAAQSSGAFIAGKPAVGSVSPPATAHVGTQTKLTPGK